MAKLKAPSVDELMALEDAAAVQKAPSVDELMALEEQAMAPTASNMGDQAETGIRSALSSATLGITEPVVNAINAGLEATVWNPDKSFGQAYEEEKARRNLLQEQNPGSDIAGSVVGAFSPVGPAAALFKGARVLTGATKELPAAANLLQKAGKVGQEISATALAAGGQSAAENVLGDEDYDVLETMKNGALFDAGLRGALAMPGVSGKVVKSLSRSLFGVDAKKIAQYKLDGAEADKVFNEMGKEGVIQMVQDNVNKLISDVNQKKIDFADAEKAFKELQNESSLITKENKLELKEKLFDAKSRLDSSIKARREEFDAIKNALPKEGMSEVKRGVEAVKQGVFSGKAMALEALEKSGKKLEIKSIKPAIDEAIESFKVAGEAPVSDTAIAAIGRLEKLQERLSKLPKKISAKDARKVVDQLDDDINYVQGLVKSKTPEDAALTQIRRAINEDIKTMVPEFGTIMDKVAEDAQFLSVLKDRFDNEDKIVSTLSRSLQDNRFNDREVLQLLEQKTGINIIGRLEGAMNAKRMLGMDNQKLAKTMGLPERGEVAGLMSEQRKISNPRYEKFVREEMLNSSPEALRMSDAATQLKVAEEALKPFRSWSGRTTEQNINGFMNGSSVVLRQMFGQLADMTNPDMLRKLELFRISDQFERTFMNGSRNVNLWSLIGSSLFNVRSGALGLLGMSSLGPVGLAMGAIMGSLVDTMGPKMAKEVIKAMSMIEGMPTIQKIKKVGAMFDDQRVTNYLVSSFVRAFAQEQETKNEHKVYVDKAAYPQTAKDISESDALSTTEKAKAIGQLHKDGEVMYSKKMMFGEMKPKDYQPKIEPRKPEAKPKGVKDISELIKERRSREF